MPIQISLKKSTTNPTGSSGLTLGEPVFNYGNNTLWVGLGGTTTPVWMGAGVCGASGGIAAGLTYQIPTLGAVKDYFIGVSGSFLPSTTGFVSSFNGATGAVTGVSSFNGLTGAIQGVSSWNGQTGAVIFVNYVTSFNGVTGAVYGVTTSVANTFTALQTFNAGITTSGITLNGNLIASGSGKFGNGVLTDFIVPTVGLGNGGTLYLNSDSGGGGGANSITAIGDLVGDGNNTSIYVDDLSGAITMIAPNEINFSGPVYAYPGVFVNGSLYTTSGVVPLTTTAANQTLTNLNASTYRTVEFLIQASTGSAYEALKLLVVHDGTNTYNTQYGIVRSGGSLGTYTTTIIGGNLRLRVTPTTANTTYTFSINALQ